MNIEFMNTFAKSGVKSEYGQVFKMLSYTFTRKTYRVESYFI